MVNVRSAFWFGEPDAGSIEAHRVRCFHLRSGLFPDFRSFLRRQFPHNGLVAGSSPAGPTSLFNDLAIKVRSGLGFVEPKAAPIHVTFWSEE